MLGTNLGVNLVSLKIICFRVKYLMPYNCKLLVLRIVSESYKCFNIIIIYSLEFFASALADGHSLEVEWQQVSSSLLDSFQYSGRSQ